MGQDYHITNKKHHFFEGWYFKNQVPDQSIAFIPGANIDAFGNKSAFIQIITDTNSYRVDYDFSDFKTDPNQFLISIGNSTFGSSGISIDIDAPKIKIKGHLSYTAFTPVRYTMMGHFSFFPEMECNHEVLSLSHKINGNLKINGESFSFNEGIGYLEKDWGRSFPKTYLWTQCNVFEKSSASIMVSIADIPFLGKTFHGCICVIYYKNKEYRLATYKGVKILKCDDDGVILVQGSSRLEISFLENKLHPLLAPNKGQMSRTIHESIACKTQYTFFYKEVCLFNLTSFRASLEIVLD